MSLRRPGKILLGVLIGALGLVIAIALFTIRLSREPETCRDYDDRGNACARRNHAYTA